MAQNVKTFFSAFQDKSTFRGILGRCLPTINMSGGGIGVHGRRRRGTTQESTRDRARDTFLREVPRYEGTDDDFERAHARLYGKEEGLRPDGKHQHGSAHFPRGSERQRLHTQYSKTTKPRDNARDAYQDGLRAAEREYDRMGVEERDYYRDHTGGLAPYQHERLDPRAKRLRDLSLE